MESIVREIHFMCFYVMDSPRSRVSGLTICRAGAKRNESRLRLGQDKKGKGKGGRDKKRT